MIGAAKQLGGAFRALVALEAVGKTHAAVCETAYELPDIADCPVHAGPIHSLCCSLCCSLDAECGDACRKAPSGSRC